MSAYKLAQALQLDAEHWKKLGDQAERDGQWSVADVYRVCADQLCEALSAHQAQQSEQPAGYVTAIEEGKVLMLPRASLDLTKLVPLYAGRADAQPADKLDAERWREALMRVGATSWLNGGHMFMVNLQAPPNVMQGSVAQHFTAAIDAARAEKGGTKPGPSDIGIEEVMGWTG